MIKKKRNAYCHYHFIRESNFNIKTQGDMPFFKKVSPLSEIHLAIWGTYYIPPSPFENWGQHQVQSGVFSGSEGPTLSLWLRVTVPRRRERGNLNLNTSEGTFPSEIDRKSVV